MNRRTVQYMVSEYLEWLGFVSCAVTLLVGRALDLPHPMLASILAIIVPMCMGLIASAMGNDENPRSALATKVAMIAIAVTGVLVAALDVFVGATVAGALTLLVAVVLFVGGMNNTSTIGNTAAFTAIAVGAFCPWWGVPAIALCVLVFALLVSIPSVVNDLRQRSSAT